MQGWVDSAVMARWFDRRSAAQAPEWVRGLAVEGIIGGVGTMLTFLPILVIFRGMGFLEDVGYMTRAAYVMDGFMHSIGCMARALCRYSSALAAMCRPLWAPAFSNPGGSHPDDYACASGPLHSTPCGTDDAGAGVLC